MACRLIRTVLIITINRPERRNAFRPNTVKELIHAFNDARDDNSIDVIILTGKLSLSDLNLVYACTKDRTLMIDAQAREITEKNLKAGLELAHLENRDGGWGLHIESESTMFGSILNYVTLRLFGEGPDDGDGAMEKGRKWILDHGSATCTPSWGKMWLIVRKNLIVNIFYIKT